MLPWAAGEASKSAARCFHDWIAERRGTETAEERKHVAAVRRFLELHGASRFESMGRLAPTDGVGAPLDQKVINRAGFRRYENETIGGETEFLFLPEVWKSEVCAGLDARAVAKTLAKRGMLKPGSGGKLQNFQRVPGSKNPVRCYVIPSHILGEGGAEADG